MCIRDSISDILKKKVVGLHMLFAYVHMLFAMYYVGLHVLTITLLNNNNGLIYSLVLMQLIIRSEILNQEINS